MLSVRDTVAEKFTTLRDQWKADRKNVPSVGEHARHPAYLEIIGLGTPVVPYILADLEAEPDWWFPALRAITGEDPVQPEDRGKLHAMAAAWLRWGRAKRVDKQDGCLG